MEKYDTFRSMNEQSGDGYMNEYSVVSRWIFHEREALQMLETSFVRNESLDYSFENDLIGTFRGREKTVFTYFKKGYIQEVSFQDFIALLTENEGQEKHSAMTFTRDDSCYSTDGNCAISLSNHSTNDTKKKSRSGSFLENFLNKIKRKKSDKK